MTVRWSEEELALYMQHRGIPRAPAHPVSEKVFQAAVLKIAREAGYMTFHVHDSRKSAEGYPDLTLVHPTRRELPVFLCELKTQAGQVTAAQQAWVEALGGRQTVSTIWRPDDVEMIRRWLC